MTTQNQALFDCLEDYMDELIERFEEFAKKSLVLITAALGSVVILAMYFLRQASTPSPPCRTIHDKAGSKTCIRGRELTLKCSRSGASRKKKEKCSPNVVLFCDKGTESNPEPCINCNTKKPSRPLITSRSSADEKLIREIRLSTCSKTCPSCHRQSPSRISPKCSTTAPKILKVCTKPPNADANTCTSCIPPAFTPSCLPKHHLSKSRQCSKYIGIRTSCCSMCCYDDDMR